MLRNCLAVFLALAFGLSLAVPDDRASKTQLSAAEIVNKNAEAPGRIAGLARGPNANPVWHYGHRGQSASYSCNAACRPHEHDLAASAAGNGNGRALCHGAGAAAQTAV